VSVLDASVALRLVLPDEDASTWDGLIRTLSTTGALAPTVWTYEVASGISVAQRRGRISPQNAADALEAAARLPIEFVHLRTHDLVELAHATGLSVYDASYLAVCRMHDLPLASFDARMRDAATSLGIDLL